jgi:lipid-A-disaccharide synthase
MKLLVSALEPSSNLHLKEVLKYCRDVKLSGIFDKSLGSPLYDTSDIAVMGFVDAIKKFSWFRKIENEMVELAREVDKVLLMDSSGFNLPLAQKLKEKYKQIEIIYYILPQIWASRPKRIKKLELYCDKLLGILPFEIDYYNNLKVRYVGHPLLDEIKIFHNKNSSNIAFMAGSRRGEIERLLPIFKKLRKQVSNKRAVLIIPSFFSKKKIADIYGDISEFEISRDAHRALADAEFAFICSGTATLEAALIGTPFTLVYIAKGIDYFIGKYILNIKEIGLANIILTHFNNSTLHSELLQSNVTVNNLLEEYLNSDRELFAKKAKELRKYLKYGSSERVANIILADKDKDDKKE